MALATKGKPINAGLPKRFKAVVSPCESKSKRFKSSGDIKGTTSTMDFLKPAAVKEFKIPEQTDAPQQLQCASATSTEIEASRKKIDLVITKQCAVDGSSTWKEWRDSNRHTKLETLVEDLCLASDEEGDCQVKIFCHNYILFGSNRIF